MRLSRCADHPLYFERIHRAIWMRVFSRRRLYRCAACGEHLFIQAIPEEA